MSGLDTWLTSQTARRFFDDFSKLAHAVHLLAQPHHVSDYDKPRYQHKAPANTAFLGQWQQYDLYYMPLPNGSDVYLARYGDNPDDTRSSEIASPLMKGAPGGWIMALKTAQFIAKELELQQPRTRKNILIGEHG